MRPSLPANGISSVRDLDKPEDELSVDKLMHDLNKIGTTVRHNNMGNNLLETFWAPNGHLAVKKARVFVAAMKW